MTDKEKLQVLETECYLANDLLLAKLGMLSETATKILGYFVIADICGGNEIEFRKVNNNGIPDDFSTIRMEEILKSV